MKDDWERSEQVIEVPNNQLQTMIESFLPGKVINSLNLLTGGLSNANYRFTVKGVEQVYVLRIYKNGIETAQKEVAIWDRVKECLPLPTIYYTDFSLAIVDEPFSISEWMPGIPLKEVLEKASEAETQKVARALGDILSKADAFTFSSEGFLKPNLDVDGSEDMDFIKFIEECLFQGHTSRWLGESLTTELWQFVKANAPLLNEQKDPPVLVHSDFNEWNILINPQNMMVSAVLDWEFAFSGSRLWDIGNLLRFTKPHHTVFETGLIESYCVRGGRLPEKWKQTTKLLDLLALCDLLNREDCGPNKVSDIRLLIESTIK